MYVSTEFGFRLEHKRDFGIKDDDELWVLAVWSNRYGQDPKDIQALQLMADDLHNDVHILSCDGIWCGAAKNQERRDVVQKAHTSYTTIGSKQDITKQLKREIDNYEEDSKMKKEANKFKSQLSNDAILVQWLKDILDKPFDVDVESVRPNLITCIKNVQNLGINMESESKRFLEYLERNVEKIFRKEINDEVQVDDVFYSRTSSSRVKHTTWFKLLPFECTNDGPISKAPINQISSVVVASKNQDLKKPVRWFHDDHVLREIVAKKELTKLILFCFLQRRKGKGVKRLFVANLARMVRMS